MIAVLYEIRYWLYMVLHVWNLRCNVIKCPVCYEEYQHGPHNPSPEHWRSYACEKCGWQPPEEFYYIQSYQDVDCTDFDKETSQIVAAPPDGFKAYPIYGNQQYNSGMTMEFGIEAYDWDETHYCPFHGEFTFMDGNC